MSESPDHSDSASVRRRQVLPALLVLVLVAIGGWLYLASNRNHSGSTAQQQMQTLPSSQEEIKQALAPLQQSIKDIQTASQRTADQTSDLQRQLSAQQGEQKLLAEQIGALSARVDKVTNAEAAAPAKRRRAPR